MKLHLPNKIPHKSGNNGPYLTDILIYNLYKKNLNWDRNIHPKFIETKFYGQFANATNYPENSNSNGNGQQMKREI
jgi:hypothetical protein